MPFGEQQTQRLNILVEATVMVRFNRVHRTQAEAVEANQTADAADAANAADEHDGVESVVVYDTQNDEDDNHYEEEDSEDDKGGGRYGGVHCIGPRSLWDAGRERWDPGETWSSKVVEQENGTAITEVLLVYT